MLHIYFLMFHMVYFSMSIDEHRWTKIPCRAKTEHGVKYRRITWYKVEKSSSDLLTGLVLKDLLKNTTTLFKFANHSYEVGEDNSLLVPGTAEEDCGVYRCTLWPPLGHYIQEGNTEYYTADCIKPQLQAVSSKEDELFTNHQVIIAAVCVLSLMACAVIVFLTHKMIKKDNIMKKIVQTDEII